MGAVAAFDRKSVPCSPIYTIQDIFEDPHCQVRKNLIEGEDPRLGRVQMPGVTPRLSRTPGEFRRPAPELGQHNAEVYRELLDLSAAEMIRLKAQGSFEGPACHSRCRTVFFRSDSPPKVVQSAWSRMAGQGHAGERARPLGGRHGFAERKPCIVNGRA